MRITETARAQANFTPQSRAVMDEATLDSRLGTGTVAGGLNDQIRFRFDQQGSPDRWKLLPDNEISAKLLASKSGPLLERKLQGVLGNLDAAHGAGVLNVRGVMLPDDEQGYAAGWMLQNRDARANGTPSLPESTSRELYQSAKLVANIVDAQSIMGWVQFPPDVARNLLTSVGAYTPAPTDDKVVRSGSFASKDLPEILGHELQHRVSEADFADPSYMGVEWLEEGTATLLAMHGKGRTDNVRGWSTSPQSHAGHVGAPDHVDVGWKPWQRDRDAFKASGIGDKVEGNYFTSVDTLKRLVKLAGVDRRTSAGQTKVFDLLQGTPVKNVPGKLATAILEHNGIQRNLATDALLTGAIIRSNSPDGIKLVDDLVAALRTK